MLPLFSGKSRKRPGITLNSELSVATRITNVGTRDAVL